jgi:hypothetical protein
MAVGAVAGGGGAEGRGCVFCVAIATPSGRAVADRNAMEDVAIPTTTATTAAA